MIISKSVYLTITWQKTSKHSETVSKGGRGLPLHKFDNAQVPFLIAIWISEFATIYAKFLAPPHLIIKSLKAEQSPDIFPTAQIAYSYISG